MAQDIAPSQPNLWPYILPTVLVLGACTLKVRSGDAYLVHGLSEFRELTASAPAAATMARMAAPTAASRRRAIGVRPATGAVRSQGVVIAANEPVASVGRGQRQN
jgi:hypothetical protein